MIGKSEIWVRNDGTDIMRLKNSGYYYIIIFFKIRLTQFWVRNNAKILIK